MEERDMRQNFSVILASLMEDIVKIILHSDEIDADEQGVWGTLNGEYLLVTWEELAEIRDIDCIADSTRDYIHQFMKQRGKA